METFRQKLKSGTNRITYFDGENPRHDCLLFSNSKGGNDGELALVMGNRALKKFKKWINSIDNLK